MFSDAKLLVEFSKKNEADSLKFVQAKFGEGYLDAEGKYCKFLR